MLSFHHNYNDNPAQSNKKYLMLFCFAGKGGTDELHARVDHDDGSGRFHQLERHASRRVENHHLDNRTQECGRAQGNHGYSALRVCSH